MLLSAKPLAKYPSGRTAKEKTQLVWPVKVLIIFPSKLEFFLVVVAKKKKYFKYNLLENILLIINSLFFIQFSVTLKNIYFNSINTLFT